MTSSPSPCNRVRERRTAQGLTQAELARRAGVSRTAVTAIEGARLVPSVSAALALAEALDTTVEELFGRGAGSGQREVRAWESAATRACWRATVEGQVVLYPAHSAAMLTPLPDARGVSAAVSPGDTLVLASCDPAAGLLASQYAAATGLRLLVIPRSSRQALELLRQGLVHLAGLHLSTRDLPDRNSQVVRETLGEGYDLLRLARWQEGITSLPSAGLRSVRAATSRRLTWIGREPGSGARQCQDQLLGAGPGPRRIAGDHRGVIEAVRSGWANAGVCVRLVSAEAGLAFLPVQEEAYDVCFSSQLAQDRRLAAFLAVVRSAEYRQLIGELPGYDVSETGHVWSVR